MIVIVVIMVGVLLVGMLCGALLADRLYHAGATTAGKRALERLEFTLDGLETAYLVQAARLACEQDLAQPRGGAGRYDTEWPVHLPQPVEDARVPRIPRNSGPLGRRGRSGGPTGSVRPDR